MAAWVPKIAVRVTKNQNVYAASHAIQSYDYSSQPRIIKNPTTASLKRGTGGRSSFNGIVCTIFGCGGFVGPYVCNRLGKIGTQLILPYRGERYALQPLKLCGDLGQVLYHPFHLRDEESIIKSIKYSNVVINLIGSDVETNNFSYHDVHVEGARTLARLAKECKVERFIHVSCLNADPKPKPIMLPNGSEVLKTKWQGECAVKEEFPDATIIRPSVIYGQEDKFINHYLSFWRRTLISLPLWKGGEETEKQPIHISDVASGIVATVLDPRTAGKTYQFVGPKRYKLNILVKWLYDVSTCGMNIKTIFPVDMKEHPLFDARVALCEMTHRLYPATSLSWESLEKHHTSDKVLKGLPTLEDLGIIPADMETRIPWELRPKQELRKFSIRLNEMMAPPPPETVPLS